MFDKGIKRFEKTRRRMIYHAIKRGLGAAATNKLHRVMGPRCPACGFCLKEEGRIYNAIDTKFITI